MKTKLELSQISEKGRRDYNEDFLLANDEKALYIVCDGVGGSEKGEVASKLVCKSFNEFLQGDKEVTSESILQALVFTEKQFDKKIDKSPECKGMATTLALLNLTKEKATIGHVGDSRVYHIRDGEILFHTNDHSYVNELVASGYITEKEALTHPKRNQITRAIVSSKEPTDIDVTKIEDIKENDFFMLCTDGVLESIDKVFIKNNFLSNKSTDEIKESISKACQKNSDDNYTAIIVKTDNRFAKASTTVLLERTNVEKTVLLESNKTIVSDHNEKQKTEKKEVIIEEIETPKKNPLLRYVLLGLLGIVILAGSYIFFSKKDNTQHTTTNINSGQDTIISTPTPTVVANPVEKEKKIEKIEKKATKKSKKKEVLATTFKKKEAKQQEVPTWKKNFDETFNKIRNAENSENYKSSRDKYTDLLSELPASASEERNKVSQKIKSLDQYIQKEEMVVIKDKRKEKPKEESKETPEEEVKEQPKEESKETPEEEVKEQPKEESKETPKEKVKEQPKEENKGKPKEEVKEQPKEENKGKPKEEEQVRNITENTKEQVNIK